MKFCLFLRKVFSNSSFFQLKPDRKISSICKAVTAKRFPLNSRENKQIFFYLKGSLHIKLIKTLLLQKTSLDQEKLTTYDSVIVRMSSLHHHPMASLKVTQLINFL